MSEMGKSALAELSEEASIGAAVPGSGGPTAGGVAELKRARAYIAEMPEAISGADGHGATFKVARRLADFHLSEDQIFRVLWEDYNPRCSPPWSERELRHKAREGFNARVKNDMGDRERPTERRSTAAQATPSPRPVTVTEVIAEWRVAGSLVHEPTGITKLDELTGGGPVYGSRWYLAGAPDAGKTALLLQIAHTLAGRGVHVGLLAVDEEPSDVVTRLAQRIGYARHHCEARDPRVLEKMQAELGSLPIRFYDATWTIEAAAADLAAHGKGGRAMLGIDSVQTVACDAERAEGARDLSEVAAVTARVRAIRAVASVHRLIVMATSEFGRSAYSSSDRAQQSSTMASGKWSGAIEYSARVLIGLRSVSGEPDLIELDLAKNKHGPRDQLIHLKLDRRAQTLMETTYEPPPSGRVRGDAASVERVAQDALAVARVLLRQPGLGSRELRAAARAATGAGQERVDAALAYLGEAVQVGTGPKNKALRTLDASRLPEALKQRLENDNADG
jgi:hypothetical protein